MKRALFKWVNLLMACIVLLSSTGFGLVEHTCQMRGKKKTMVVAFSDAKTQPGCSSDRQSVPTDQTVLSETQCCQDDQQYENITVSSSLSQFVAKFVKSIAETVIHGVVAVMTWLIQLIFAEKSSTLSAIEVPPSLSGRDIITLVRSLLI